MKTTIKISGQIGGNSSLARKLSGYSTSERGNFGDIFHHYKSRADAQRDLSECWQRMKADGMVTSSMEYIYRRNGRAYKITYDASRAEILNKPL